MQPVDESSRQVDGRCLVLILSSVLPLAAATSVAVAVAVSLRVTGCPQNH
ncbi:TPA: hypothetical protein WIB75_002119, partial [Neisseria meningitidis]